MLESMPRLSPWQMHVQLCRSQGVPAGQDGFRSQAGQGTQLIRDFLGVSHAEVPTASD